MRRTLLVLGIIGALGLGACGDPTDEGAAAKGEIPAETEVTSPPNNGMLVDDANPRHGGPTGDTKNDINASQPESHGDTKNDLDYPGTGDAPAGLPACEPGQTDRCIQK